MRAFRFPPSPRLSLSLSPSPSSPLCLRRVTDSNNRYSKEILASVTSNGWHVTRLRLESLNDCRTHACTVPRAIVKASSPSLIFQPKLQLRFIAFDHSSRYIYIYICVIRIVLRKNGESFKNYNFNIILFILLYFSLSFSSKNDRFKFL